MSTIYKTLWIASRAFEVGCSQSVKMSGGFLKCGSCVQWEALVFAVLNEG